MSLYSAYYWCTLGCFLSLEVDLITISAGKSQGSPLNRFLCHGGKMGFNGPAIIRPRGLWLLTVVWVDQPSRTSVRQVAQGRPRTLITWPSPGNAHGGCLTLGVDADIVLLDGGFMLLGHS